MGTWAPRGLGMRNYPVMCGLFQKSWNKDPYLNNQDFMESILPVFDGPVEEKGSLFPIIMTDQPTPDIPPHKWGFEKAY